MFTTFLLLTVAAGPLPPQQSLELIETNPQLKVELVASEPNVIDPVSARFDQQGRLWVVEMRDYPTGPVGGQGPQGTIKILRDTDQDGFYETAKVFASGLVFPTGVQPWQDGAIVTLSGSIEFMRDADGDDVCDQREVWFQGFAEDNTQLRANHPSLGPDGLVYVANGLRGGKVEVVSDRWPKSAEPIPITGRDFVFNPHGRLVASETGGGQYGMSITDFNQRMICSNRNPCDWVALPAAVIARNPLLSTKDATINVAATGTDSMVKPLVKAWTTSNLHAGQFTAACGVHLYGGSAIPELLGNVFTCDPTGSLVQRQILSAKGAALTAQRAGGDSEFLASRDPWFRAVDVTEGPDGNLYVIDMYRAVIEHPDFVPTELKVRPDERLGNDRGRIYRIRSKLESQPEVLNWNSMTTEQLVATLNHENRWQRETAGRLLWETEAKGAGGHLKQMVASADTRPEAKFRAVLLLAAFDAIEAPAIQQILNDPHPALRALAVKLSPDRSAWLKLAKDDSPEVRLAVALRLGEPLPESAAADLTPVVQAWVELARRDSNDRLLATALLATDETLCLPFFSALCADTEAFAASSTSLAEHLAQRIGASQAALEFFDALANWKGPLTLRLPVALKWSEGVAASRRNVVQLMASATAEQQAMWSQLSEQSRQVIPLVKESPEGRIAGIRFTRFEKNPEVESLLWTCAEENTEPAVRIAAIEALATQQSKQLPEYLLSHLSTFSPELRRRSVDLLIGNSQWVPKLLDAIESKQITRASIDLVQSQRLGKLTDKTLAARANELLSASSASRKSVIEQYRPVVSQSGDPVAGKQVFQTACANCHRIGDLGRDLGPDISDSRTKTTEQLLQSILDPDAAIDAGFVRYTLLTVDGRVLDGLLVDETAERVALRPIEGDDLIIAKEDIEQLKSAGVSLMPTGFEATIPPHAMRDLVAYIKQWRYLDGAVPADLGQVK